MAATVLNEGMSLLANILVGNDAAPGTGLQARLFTSPSIFDSTNVLADFVETTDSGLLDISLPGASWAPSVTGGIATFTYPEFDMTAIGGSGTTIYGVLIYDVASGTGLWAEALATPWVNPAAGEQLALTPTFNLGNV